MNINSLRKEIKIYKKNEKAICDYLTLYEFLLTGDTESLAFNTVLDVFIKDLEDDEINIPFNEKNFKEIILNMQHQDSKLFNNTGSYPSLRQNYTEDFRLNKIIIFYDRKYYVNPDKKVNFVLDLYRNNCVYVIKEILCSNMNINKKCEFLFDCLMHCIECNSDGFTNLFLVNRNFLYDIKPEIRKEKLECLRTKFREYVNNFKYKDKIIKAMSNTEDGIIPWMVNLQKNNLVDFTNNKDIVLLDDRHIEVSLFVTNYSCKQQVNFFEYYQLKDYKNVSEKQRNLDDLVILKTLNSFDIAKFVSLSNFKFTEEKIKFIGKRFFEEQVYLERSLNEFINYIKNAILLKSKNKQEYKQNQKYANLLSEISNCEAYFENIRLKEKEKELEQQKLDNKRQELSTLLFNINDIFQENVPSRKLIKDVNIKNVNNC